MMKSRDQMLYPIFQRLNIKTVVGEIEGIVLCEEINTYDEDTILHVVCDNGHESVIRANEFQLSSITELETTLVEVLLTHPNKAIRKLAKELYENSSTS